MNRETAPILLFNEADAVFSTRKDVMASLASQTENAIQNIILQEMEGLTGVLIATTNLTQNFDKAFERRFLYKIEFAKPETVVRKSIWQSIIPALSDTGAAELAARFDFSGGQIENIARKRTVELIIHGADPSLDTLFRYCEDELLEKTVSRIGFAV
jgi:SpoVK/Ycf46/Vps4 family AAA+-type ATPase